MLNKVIKYNREVLNHLQGIKYLKICSNVVEAVSNLAQLAVALDDHWR